MRVDSLIDAQVAHAQKRTEPQLLIGDNEHSQPHTSDFCAEMVLHFDIVLTHTKASTFDKRARGVSDLRLSA
jgi:hypothetical protein